MSQSLFRGVVGLSLLLSMGCGAMQVAHYNTDFKVMNEGQWNQVHNYNVDPTLRKMSPKQLCKFLAAGCKIRVSKCTNGDYVLRAFVPGKGGGVGGATAGVVVGHALVWGTCHGIAAVASIFGTPAAGAAVETAISVGSPAIEAAAMKAGIALGVFFAVITGPV